MDKSDLMPGYMEAEESAEYLRTTTRKIALYRRYGLLKYAKLGKNYLYRKEWLDDFMETWSGYDLSNEEKVKFSINARNWKQKHGIS